MSDAASFKPMLAKDGDLSKLTFPVVVQPKLDGIRAAVVDGRLLTRTLKEVPNREVYEALSRPEFNGLDGELLVGPVTAEDAYRRTTSFVMAPNKTGESWTFHVFDKWDEPGGFCNRYNALHDCHSRVVCVQTLLARNVAEVEGYEAGLIALGHEGIIVRIPDQPYKFGRSGKTGPLLKVKRFVDFEALVIGVYEEQHNGNVATTNELGRTQRTSHKAGKIGKGTLGGLHVRALNGPAEGVEFKVGTGFTAQMREDLWQEADGLIDLVAVVKSFPVGVKSKPRHPVWKGWRLSNDLPSPEEGSSSREVEGG